jgi:CHAT domain-containing protein/tetratricopeptide (TPR) repeat protein
MGWTAPSGVTPHSPGKIDVGKGKRVREERRNRVDPHEAVGELLQIEDGARFIAWNERYGTCRRAILERLTEWCEKPTVGPSFRPWYRLVEDAAHDPAGAWVEMERTRSELITLEVDLMASLDDVVERLEGGDALGAISAVEEVVPRTEMVPLVRGAFELVRASALSALADCPLAQRQEEGIAALNCALECATPGERAARVLLPLANLWAERREGDRRRNIGVAVDLYRLGLDEITGQECSDVESGLQINLAMALLRQDGGERRPRLEEALGHCEAALQARTLECDPEGWAHAQINRAIVVTQLAQIGGAEKRDAEQIYEVLISRSDAFDDYLILSGAHHELARCLRNRAERSPEDRVRIYERGNEAEVSAEEESLLRSAAQHLQLAESILSANEDSSVAIGRLLAERTVVLEMLGEEKAALTAGRGAMAMLTPSETPQACLDAGTKLGAMLLHAGEWAEAAAVYRLTLEAAELLFQTSLSREARAQMTQRFGHLGRWASLAFVGNDDLEEAVIALEGSRTRELRFRTMPGTGDPEVLSELPSGLREEYEAAASEFAAIAPLSSGEADESRLQAVLSAIRIDPRFKDFLRGPRVEQIYAGAQPGWPLVYVNPTPVGTLLLAVASDREPVIQWRFLEAPTSTEIFMKLLGAESDQEPGSCPSYLNATGSFGEPQWDLEEAIDGVELWIGEEISRPIAEVLEPISDQGLTLIVSGPLATYPLGAARWSTVTSQECLLDRYEVHYAPSATAAGLSRQRALQRKEQAPFLVGLGNPLGDLPAAQAELDEIASHFDGTAQLARGRDANAAFFRSHFDEASHLHLACHGSAAVFAPEEVGIQLSDEVVSVVDLAGLGGLNTRVAVLSACQTAVPDIGHLPGEAISASTALLLAGSASVFATLWPVDDAATAMLMIKFYELHMTRDLTPVAALRESQLWLRDLDGEDEREFLEQHPALGAEFRRRRLSGDEPGHRRGRGRGGSSTARPYSHPGYWAPFIAVGG